MKYYFDAVSASQVTQTESVDRCINLPIGLIPILAGFLSLLYRDYAWEGSQEDIEHASQAAQRVVRQLYDQCDEREKQVFTRTIFLVQEAESDDDMACDCLRWNNGVLGFVHCGVWYPVPNLESGVPVSPPPEGGKIPGIITPPTQPPPPPPPEITIDALRCAKAIGIWNAIDRAYKSVLAAVDALFIPYVYGELYPGWVASNTGRSHNPLGMSILLGLVELWQDNGIAPVTLSKWVDDNQVIKQTFICDIVGALDQSRTITQNDLDTVSSYRFTYATEFFDVQWLAGGVLSTALAPYGAQIVAFIDSILDELPLVDGEQFIGGIAQNLTRAEYQKYMDAAIREGNFEDCEQCGGGVDPWVIPPAIGKNKLLFDGFAQSDFRVEPNNSRSELLAPSDGAGVAGAYKSEHLEDIGGGFGHHGLGLMLKFYSAVNVVGVSVTVRRNHARLFGWAASLDGAGAVVTEIGAQYTDDVNKTEVSVLEFANPGIDTKYLYVGLYARNQEDIYTPALSLLAVEVTLQGGAVIVGGVDF